MTDRELANNVINNNDQHCFAEIVKRYSGIVFSKTLAIVKREELAKEVTQQTFIRAYERLSYWRNDSLGPWLTTIAMHLALNELECERRKGNAQSPSLPSPSAFRHTYEKNRMTPNYGA